MSTALPCPCDLGQHAGRAYADCCGRWHGGPAQQPVPDALALMRSRYSAFVLGDATYLLASWHPRTRPATLALEAGLRWLGLQIKAAAQQDADHATVEFVARSKLAGRAHRLHETSRFERQDGRWFYVDGDLHGG